MKYIIIFLSFCSVSWGHLGLYLPRAAIEYNAGTFQKTAANGVLHDVTENDPSKWFNGGTSIIITKIIGYAHLGEAGIPPPKDWLQEPWGTQILANKKIAAIQIWGWKDTDGDGKATINDSKVGSRTTKWVKLSELLPSADNGSGSRGNVVGWNTDDTSRTATSEWADILQVGTNKGTAIIIEKSSSWLLLIRVVDITGNTNLFNTVNNLGGSEQWDDGDTSNGIGSDVPRHKYLDENGNTPGSTDGRILDNNVVWIYVPKTN